MIAPQAEVVATAAKWFLKNQFDAQSFDPVLFQSFRLTV